MSLWFALDFVVLCMCLAAVPYFGWMAITSVAAILCGFPRPKTRQEVTNALPPSRRFLVAIPAHDEEAGVVATVTSCKSFNYPADLFQVVVIADNCSDATAVLARGAGARVLERHDATKKSKGYAIEFLIDSLTRADELASLDALMIIDADSTAHPELLRRCAEILDSGEEWIQCYDTVRNADETWRTRLMAYAFSMINGVTLLGQCALGLGAGFRGNGMCLSTAGLRRMPWNSHGLAEDLEYSWSVRIAGGRIAFASDVSVHATMLTKGGQSSRNQRLRWEYGRDRLRRTMLGPLLRSSNLGWCEKSAALLELTMPAMVSLIATYVLLILLASFRLPDLFARNAYCYFYSIGLCLTVGTIGIVTQALSPFLLRLVPWGFSGSLLFLPYFAIWKVVVSWGGAPRSWLPTTREPASQIVSRFPSSASLSTPQVENAPLHGEMGELRGIGLEPAE